MNLAADDAFAHKNQIIAGISQLVEATIFCIESIAFSIEKIVV